MARFPDLLQEAFRSLQSKHTFKVGDLVRWKKRLKNRRFPGYAQPAIVLQVLNEPIFDETADPSSPYFKEPLDIVLGVLDDDCNLVSFYFDSHKFEPFQEE